MTVLEELVGGTGASGAAGSVALVATGVCVGVGVKSGVAGPASLVVADIFSLLIALKFFGGPLPPFRVRDGPRPAPGLELRTSPAKLRH